MKIAVALLLSCAALCVAQESKTESKTETVKRLASVTWDLTIHKLICVVENGAMVDGEFVPSSAVKYEVSPDDAYMAVGGEQRSFAEEEAANLHLLLDVLSRYCADSVVWWDHGNGSPTQKSPDPATKPEQPAQPKPTSAPISKTVKVALHTPQLPSSAKTAELVAAKGH